MPDRRDFRLYLVTDRSLCLGRRLETIVAAAVCGGVTAVQVRDKNCPTQEYIDIARRVKSVLQPIGVPLIINDRLDVALAAGADGVHIGQDDMPYSEARRILGPAAIIGLSVESPQQAAEAEGIDVDYLGVSPIFATPTKPDTRSLWGIEGLRALRSRSRRVLVAIGGLNAENAGAVIEAGADGIAVVSAICSAPAPEEAARELRRVIDRARRERGIPA